MAQSPPASKTAAKSKSGTNARTTTRIQRKNTAVILEAALDVFSANGFRGSTVDQIARASGLSKPNLLYYFPSKEAMHAALLAQLMDTWLDPLHALDETGDPLTEILLYVERKLEISRDFPRESRLFANEIIQGAPRMGPALGNDLKPLVDEKARVIERWISEGKIAAVNPHHLIFSIWSLTQHYADFNVQVHAVLGGDTVDPYPEAQQYLATLFTRMLTP